VFGVCNRAGLVMLNGVTLANWFCWKEADGIGLELYRVASFVVIAVLKTLDGFASDIFLFII
jgi:hypothetical protein